MFNKEDIETQYRKIVVSSNFHLFIKVNIGVYGVAMVLALLKLFWLV